MKYRNNSLTPLTDEEIETKNIPLNEMWMLQWTNNEVSGPYHSDYLRELFTQDSTIFIDVMVFNLQTERWMDFKNTPQLQRRKPSLMLNNIGEDADCFFLLKEGQKDGPYSRSEILKKLDESLLMYHDLVSSDYGNSWHKIHEFQEFDRRSHNLDSQLPYSPSSEILKSIDAPTLDVIKKIKQRNEEIDALAGLAFIGHGNDKGQMLEDPKAKKSNEEKENYSIDENSKFYQFYIQLVEFLKENKRISSTVGSMLILVLLISTYSLKDDNKEIAKEFKQSQKIEKRDKELVKVERSEKNTIQKPIKRLTAKKPKPIIREIKRDSSRNNDRQITRQRSRNRERARNKDKNNIRDPYYDDYKDDYDLVDVEDPRVREELSREMANTVNDAQENIERELATERELIDRIEDEDMSPEMERDLEERIEHFEEISDFD